MPIRKSLHGATRRARHGARQRRAPVSFDRWLDRLVAIAVSTALLVGGVALAVAFL
ncbi:hypothetical protein [Litchfieldella rifensis]|uniref:Uncharacterized protein n=1 Tax=Litchfieldella rifensis TaxID=762643 RepID=A0ABV7LJR1_9GAMM